MKLILTDKVAHKYNKDYLCLMVQFEDEDKHFFKLQKNWLPKSAEVFALHKLMSAVDPKYRQLLLEDENNLKTLISANQIAIKELGKDIKGLNTAFSRIAFNTPTQR